MLVAGRRLAVSMAVDEPRYNIRAVERMTGVPAATLRSWERRYGFPAPLRTPTARRLYSDHDVNRIRWVKARTERGLAAGQAIRWARSGGAEEPSPAPAVPAEGRDLVQSLLTAVCRYDERAAEEALAAAFARFAPDTVITDVLAPALIEIGERWARGGLAVSVEHFAARIILRRLYALLGQQPAIGDLPAVVLASVPGEQHEIGLVMVALFLRWAGLRAVVLGADVPVADLRACVRDISPAAVCLSAVTLGAAESLTGAVAALRAAGVRVPLFAGGPAAPAALLPPDVSVVTDDLYAAAERIARTAHG
jgi:methanogenic corrinoid protein MtbC1